jgi:hypothetical protein
VAHAFPDFDHPFEQLNNLPARVERHRAGQRVIQTDAITARYC